MFVYNLVTKGSRAAIELSLVGILVEALLGFLGKVTGIIGSKANQHALHHLTLGDVINVLHSVLILDTQLGERALCSVIVKLIASVTVDLVENNNIE